MLEVRLPVLVLFFFCVNISSAAAVSVVLPALYDIGSLGFPPRRVVNSTNSTLGTSCFLAGDREAELKPTNFSSSPELPAI